MDLRASFHILFDRRLFTTYREGNFGMIKMKNHERCKVIDNGDVSVMTNMSHKLIWKNVRHVLEFRLNLMLDRMIEGLLHILQLL